MPDVGPVSSLTARTAAALAATDSFYLDDGAGGDFRVAVSTLKQHLATAALAAGILVASSPFATSQTWNNAAVTFTATDVNVTDTASAAGSLLATWRVADAVKASISKAGLVTAASLALGGATIGSNALAVTGTTLLTGDVTIPGASRSVVFGTAASSSASINAYGGFMVSNGSGQLANFGQFTNSLEMASGFTISWDNNAIFNGTKALTLSFAAAGVLAIGTTAANKLGSIDLASLTTYDTYASATDYHRAAFKTANTTLSGVTGASVTATGLIPDGAVLVGVTSKVTTGLGTTGGTTGYTIGDGSDVDRWGAIVGTATGTSSDNRDWTATTVQAFTAASDIVITATGGNFDGTGVIYLSVQYLIGQSD